MIKLIAFELTRFEIQVIKIEKPYLVGDKLCFKYVIISKFLLWFIFKFSG